MSLVGKRVKVPSVKLYEDYDGLKPIHSILGGIYKCDNIAENKLCPIHIINENGESGWVRCYFTGTILLDTPKVYVLTSDALCIN